jgi:hypothetical protein
MLLQNSLGGLVMLSIDLYLERNGCRETLLDWGDPNKERDGAGSLDISAEIARIADQVYRSLGPLPLDYINVSFIIGDVKQTTIEVKEDGDVFDRSVSG